MTAEAAIALFRFVIDLVLAVVPHEQLRTELDDAARRRADAIADAAQRAKFG